MSRKVIKSITEAKDKDTRTYTLTGTPETLNQFEEVLSLIQYLGNVGASRTIKLWVDGDGSARIKVKSDKALKDKKLDIDGDLNLGID